MSTTKKTILWILVAFVVFFIATKPAGAAAAFKSLGSVLMTIGAGFATFFSDLVK